MKYESVKDIQFTELKLQNKTTYKQFKYSIDRLSLGKRAQSKIFILLMNSSINYLYKNFKKIKFYEDNSVNKGSIKKEIYSKSWWNFDF